jgi:hypothetical protein
MAKGPKLKMSIMDVALAAVAHNAKGSQSFIFWNNIGSTYYLQSHIQALLARY